MSPDAAATGWRPKENGTARNKQANAAALDMEKGGQADDSPSRPLGLVRILRSSPQATVSPLTRCLGEQACLCLASRFFGDGKFLAPLVNAERGGRWLKCEGTSCLPDIYASHLFLAPRDEWTDSGAVCPYPCPPAGAGSAVLSTNGGAEGRSWALVPVPVNAFAQLYRPSVSRSGSGIAVGGTHAHMGWPSSCLGRSQRGAGLASRAAWRLLLREMHSFSLARTVVYCAY